MGHSGKIGPRARTVHAPSEYLAQDNINGKISLMVQSFVVMRMRMLMLMLMHMLRLTLRLAKKWTSEWVDLP